MMGDHSYIDIMESVGEYIDQRKENARLVERASEIATLAHEGQYRDEGTPYIDHVMRVSERFKNNDSVKIIALLHDVLEDSDYTYEDLEKEFGSFLIDKVQLLTKSKGYDMNIYMDNIADDLYCLKVKLSDRIDNIKSLPNCPDSNKQRKYISETHRYFLENEKIKNCNSKTVQKLLDELRAEVANAELSITNSK